MTNKLYYSDAYIKEADCSAISIETDEKNTKVILAETPFFAEGGGQSCDRGTINGFNVSSVTEENGIITHTLEGKVDIREGDSVHCVIDWDKRFARMQSHSGEHIVSGIAHRLYGVENVGFHMDDTVMTVDFDKPLSDTDIKTIEEKANAAIWQNLKITADIYLPKEAKQQLYRSKKDFDTDIRIVRIEGIDACACCAPHVKSTGEIGLILILSKVSHRGGVRITLLCGKTAYELAAKRYSQVREMAGMLVEKQDECVTALEKYMEKADAARYDSNILRERICRITADAVTPTDGITVAVCTLTPQELTKAGAMLRDKAKRPIVLLSGDDDNGYSYIITAKEYPLRAKAKEINTALSGSGGGRDEMIQGRFGAKLDCIKKYFEEFEL